MTFDVNYSEKFTQNVLLYENESQCHFHDNKNGFLKDMENMNKKVMETQKIIQKLENSEVYRIIKEFDYRNYSQRFQTDVETVLSSLIGVKKALKEVSKYGMSTKQ